MAAASSGDVMVVDRREAVDEVCEDGESEKSELESEKGGTPLEGTEEQMKIVEVRSDVWLLIGYVPCMLYPLSSAIWMS